MRSNINLPASLISILCIAVFLIPGCQAQPNQPAPLETIPAVLIAHAPTLWDHEILVPDLDRCSPILTNSELTGQSIVVNDLIVDSAMFAEPQLQESLTPPPDEIVAKTQSVPYLQPSAVTGEPVTEDLPAEVDHSKLSYWSETTGLGGRQMFELYKRMWADKTGWWWEAFGEAGYSIWDFVSTFSYYEASGYTAWSEILAEAGVRWYFATGSTYGTPGEEEAVLNWWGAFSESTADAYFAGPNYFFTLPWGTSMSNVKKMAVIGDSFEKPPSAWTKGYDPDRPFGWGNLYVCYSDREMIEERQSLLLSNTRALFIYFGEGNTAFIVPSGCAWAAGYHLRYEQECESVINYTYLQ